MLKIIDWQIYLLYRLMLKYGKGEWDAKFTAKLLSSNPFMWVFFGLFAFSVFAGNSMAEDYIYEGKINIIILLIGVFLPWGLIELRHRISWNKKKKEYEYIYKSWNRRKQVVMLWLPVIIDIIVFILVCIEVQVIKSICI